MDAIPKIDLQTLADVVRFIKRDFARATDDAVLASGCAESLAKASGSGERAARGLDALPPLLIRARAAAGNRYEYRKLVQLCIGGMVAMLDKHSQFLDEEEMRSLYRSSPGVAAIGLELRKAGADVVVVDVLDGTPAPRAGIRAGDLVVSIDGAALVTLPLHEVVNRLRGAVGSAVALRLSRPGAAKPIEVTLKRELIRMVTVRAAWTGGDVLELRVSRFNESTRNDLLREVAKLGEGAAREPRGIVLDLRENQGGMLRAAVDVSGVFLANGAAVGATYGRAQRLIESYRANDRQGLAYYGPVLAEPMARALKRAPLAVLVNQRTASGAEILASALQENGRGVIVGERTFGTGSVQTVFPLPTGAALRLTSSYWRTPKDVELDGKPLAPDLPASAEGTMREALRWVGEAGAR